MTKYVASRYPRVGGQGQAARGDGEVGGVLVEAHVPARHPGRCLRGGGGKHQRSSHLDLLPYVSELHTLRELNSPQAPLAQAPL